jgi:hypothetical protein
MGPCASPARTAAKIIVADGIGCLADLATGAARPGNLAACSADVEGARAFGQGLLPSAVKSHDVVGRPRRNCVRHATRCACPGGMPCLYH